MAWAEGNDTKIMAQSPRGWRAITFKHTMQTSVAFLSMSFLGPLVVTLGYKNAVATLGTALMDYEFSCNETDTNVATRRLQLVAGYAFPLDCTSISLLWTCQTPSGGACASLSFSAVSCLQSGAYAVSRKAGRKPLICSAHSYKKNVFKSFMYDASQSVNIGS